MDYVSRTGCRNKLASTSSFSAQETNVPLRLAKEQIALVKQVVFHYRFSDSDGPVELSYAELFLSARNDLDLEATDLTMISEDQQIIASCKYCVQQGLNATPAVSGGIGNVESTVIPIPGDGFPVVGDLTLVSFLQNVPNESPIVGVDVFYVAKRVSADEWLKVAKRSRVAPRDLNIPPRNMPFNT